MFSLFYRCRRFIPLAPLLLVNSFALAASATLNLVDQNGRPLERAVVAISSATLAKTVTTPEVHLMDQAGKRFVPDVIAIYTGDSIRFPNSDDIRHHVYSFSVPLTFELPLYSGEPANPVVFREPGMVIVGCNIHDRMRGNIYIFDKGAHAVSAAGKVTFADLPDEKLTVNIYHPEALTEPAMSFVVQASALASATVPYVVDLKLPAEDADTSGMSELEKKFQQLRKNQPSHVH